MEGGKSFPLAPGKGYGWAEAAVAEILFTFFLVLVVLSVATVESPLSEYFGLAIGSGVTAGGYAIGAVSGGSLSTQQCLSASAPRMQPSVEVQVFS